VHRRPRLSLPVLAALVAAAVAVLVGGLFAGVTAYRSRPVDVTPAPNATDPACARLGAGLPATLAGLRRVATTTPSPSVAAWGRPSIVWRCGVTPPGPTTDQCQTIDGVDWVVRPLTDGASFTTYGRDPAVQVLVPSAYAPEPLRLPPLSDVVRAVPQGEHRCS
jgi:hypothetical protein